MTDVGKPKRIVRVEPEEGDAPIPLDPAEIEIDPDADPAEKPDKEPVSVE